MSLQCRSTTSDSFRILAHPRSPDLARQYSQALPEPSRLPELSHHWNLPSTCRRLETPCSDVRVTFRGFVTLRHIPKPSGTCPRLLRLASTFRNSTLCPGTLLYVSEPVPTHGHPLIPISRLFDLRPYSDDSASLRSRLRLRDFDFGLDFDFGPGTSSTSVPLRCQFWFAFFIPSFYSMSFHSFHVTFPVPYTWHVVYIRAHLQRDPHPFLFGSPARFVIHVLDYLYHNLIPFGSPASAWFSCG